MMRLVERSALIPFTPRQAFAVVADIEAYASFLPWCSDSRILDQQAQCVTAQLTLAKSGIRQSFTTRNHLTTPTEMTMHLVEGPFTSLEGCWTFVTLGDDGTKVSLNMTFEFKNKLLDQTFGRVFGLAADTMVDAFSKQIIKVYG
jgi:ribosome-associated toxin RatA of RatAB toxin-antitoxin module